MLLEMSVQDRPYTISVVMMLFATTDADDVFTVNRNIENEGAWRVDINFMVDAGVAFINLASLQVRLINYANNGNFLGTTANDKFTVVDVTVLDGGGAERLARLWRLPSTHRPVVLVLEQSVLSIYPAFNFFAGQSYTIRMRICAEDNVGDTTCRLSGFGGNNIGLDDLSIDGFVSS